MELNTECKCLKPVSGPINLRQLAKHLGLSQTSVSLVLNRSAASASIPQSTQDRIFAAAKKLGYRPNFSAVTLRLQRTYLVGVLMAELGEHAAGVLSGIEEALLVRKYTYIMASHRHKPELIERHQRLFADRRVEAVITIDTPYQLHLPVPVVAVAGHSRLGGVANIIVNHHKAAELGLCHLMGLGHRELAFFKGQSCSSDSEVRWQTIRAVATQLGIRVCPSLVVRLEGDTASPEPGFNAAKKLLAGATPFTALFAWNDISAIGASRTFREAGLRVPEDISVLGFDDISLAAFHNPALTTIRQPLRLMGRLAAESALMRIGSKPSREHLAVRFVDPELVIRGSTGPAPSLTAKSAGGELSPHTRLVDAYS